MLLSLSARRMNPRGLILALLTSLWIAGYTVIDGLGVRTGNPLTFIAWSFAAHALVPLVVWVYLAGQNPRWVLAAGALRLFIALGLRPGSVGTNQQ